MAELSIRGIKESDIPEIYRWRNDPLTIKFSKTGKGVETQEHLDWFERISSSTSIYTQIAVLKGEPIGIIVFTKKSNDKVFDITINIAPDFRKLGIGRNFISLAEKELRGKVGKCSIQAFISEGNINSISFFEKSNYKFLQKNQSILVYEKTLT